MYDSRCYDLAEVFLADVGVTKKPDIEELAQVIQDAIEDYLSARGVEKEEVR